MKLWLHNFIFQTDTPPIPLSCQPCPKISNVHNTTLCKSASGIATSYNLTLPLVKLIICYFQYTSSFSQGSVSTASLPKTHKLLSDSQLCTLILQSHFWCVLALSHCWPSPTQLSSPTSSIKKSMNIS